MVHLFVDYSVDLRTLQFARKTLFAIVSRLCTRPSPKPNMPDRVLPTKLDGPGLFLFEVAGQNHYQPAILQLLQGRFQESEALESTAQAAEDYVAQSTRGQSRCF